jgi:predicted MPP superfamily phosphohydrolase
MPLSRRAFLKGAAAAGLVGALPTAASAEQPLRAERRTFTVTGLDPAHDGLRVAQLSDLHVGSRTPPRRIREAIAQANAWRPDLVVLTGDYLCADESGVGLMRELLRGIEPPTVAVLGNHDHRVDARGAARALVALGYAVLRNQNTTLHARPREALAGARSGSRLVIAHGPRTAEALRALGQPALCLSGHTHGGQIHIPGLTSWALRVIAHEPYERGLFRLGPVQLYVNRGVGNSAFRVRVNSAPEVTLATLRTPAVLSTLG